MRSKYLGKSSRLNDLLVETDRFFKDKGFLVSSRESDSQKVVTVRTSESAGDKILEVCLSSDPDDSLEVTFSSSDSSTAFTNSSLMSLLGGGFLTLRRQKTEETLEHLEREFWEMVDNFMVSS